MLMLLCKLSYIFFYIGLFGFGGGYAMISLIQFEVVNENAWMNASEFANLLALSQMTPGPISINAATYVGYNVLLPYGYGWAVVGSVVSTFALIAPSLLMMYLVLRFLFKNQENKYIQYLFSGLRPAVVGLIFSAGLMMMIDCDQLNNFVTGKASELTLGWKTENFGENLKEHLVSASICAATFIAVFFYKKDPMLLIALSGLAGLVIYNV